MDRCCLTCSHAAMRDKTDAKRSEALASMARLGAINCTKSPFRASFHAFGHTCKGWEQADQKAIEARQRAIERAQKETPRQD
jgi:hypothetical protein